MIRSSRKRLQTATQAIALASLVSTGWAADRTWIGGHGTWGVASNWTPTGAPQFGDSAYVGSILQLNKLVFLNTAVTLNQFKVDYGTIFDNKQHVIQTSGTLTIGASAGQSSRIMLRDAPNAFDMHVSTMHIEGQSDLWMIDNPTVFVTNKLTVGADASLFGAGTINFTGNTGPALVFDGRWVPNGVGSLTFNQVGNARLDLDGNIIADSTISVIGRSGNSGSVAFDTFTVNGTGLHDAFDDAIRIGAGNTVNMNLSEGWTLTSNGKIRIRHDGYASSAKLNSTTLTINGTIEFEDVPNSFIQDTADFNTAVVFNPSANVTLGGHDTLNLNGPADVNGGFFLLGGTGYNQIRFNGATNISGGTFTENSSFFGPSVVMNGATTYSNSTTFNLRAIQNGSAKVSTPTTIHADLLDMDGSDDAGTTWNISSHLTINASSLDDTNNDVTATINVNNSLFLPGRLTVNMAFNQQWASKGILNLSGSTLGPATVLDGSPVALGGQVNVSKQAVIQSRATFLAGGTTTIASGSSLYLNGGDINLTNQLAGGRIVGSGTLAMSADRKLTGFGTISSAIDFDDNASLLASGGTLRIDGTIIDVGIIGTANNTSTLSIGTSWNTSVAELVQLNGGTLTGLPVINDGTISGRGAITSLQLNNNGLLSSTGLGTLVINTGLAPDLDGTSETGVLNAVSGNVQITKQLADSFDGTMNIAENRSIKFDSTWTLGPAGTLNVQWASTPNPAVLSATNQLLLGTVNVGSATTLNMVGVTAFGNGAKINLSHDSSQILLGGNSLIAAGAIFSTPSSQPGSIEVAPGAALDIATGVTVDARLVNNGVLSLAGAGVGVAAVEQLGLSSGASVQVNLNGPSVGQFDRLQVIDSASIDGVLSLFPGAYDPAYLHPHPIVQATGSISGTFKTINGLALSPTKHLAVVYAPGSVVAVAAIPGDGNLDGMVNLDDFTILATSFGQTTTWIGGNFNGDAQTTLDDFTLLATNFGLAVPAAQLRVSAVPEPTMMGSIAAAGLVARRARRGRLTKTDALNLTPHKC